MISRRYRYVSNGGPASTGWGSIRPMVTPRTLALVEMSSIRAGTSFFSGTSRRITASSAEYSSTLRRRSSTVPLARSAFACAITRSEERRVGEGGRFRGDAHHGRKDTEREDAARVAAEG